MIPLLIVADASHLPAAFSALDVEVEYATALPAAASIERARPTVIVLSRGWREADGTQLRALASRAALVMAGDPGETHAPGGVAGELAIAWLPARAGEQAAMASLRWALRHAGSGRGRRRAQ